MTVGQPRTPASEPAVAEVAALGRRLRDLEAERQALAARREVWKVADGRPANLEHRCRSVAARPSELSCENEWLALAALGGEALRAGSRPPLRPHRHDPAGR